ncbi:glycoside hydrolase family 2 protein [Metabacillus halosaccharovorans]|uniref:glycoside hydrolase family 2 protein n=1 Tax=Metabacillus halosaccharovorans TaxID=930124 RepID=UPI001C1F95D1|nr:glycoside hydrolase family 2 protein [Metabacillus halosaccharovorans]MBU7591113.1 glycoside hydrolase family 2 protein [Metabacillus halosaccharovorans]
MRKTILFNKNWKFVKENVGEKEVFSALGEVINIPHTWNAIDGQDGGNDYYRGTCWYGKTFKKPEINSGDQVYLEFRGANSTAEVWINNTKLSTHDGGYSTFRVNITEALKEENELVVSVDNGPNDRVYPQKADFTFYGGIYRNVYMVIVPDSHFDLDYYGGSGLQITTEINEKSAIVNLKSYITGEAESVRYTIEGVGVIEVPVNDGVALGHIEIPDVRLWDGVEDPYLYKAKAELIKGENIVDEVDSRFGCRTFSFDKDKGFILNGRPYPLRGVSRHQDRRGVGNAITREMMKDDMGIIKEIGANTIRLAHYQHDQYFYDLCDEYGMIVWAEIPYITEHMPNGRENTITQLTELIVQNVNHPSIICWGLSNEISVTGVTDDLMENHKILNDLAHSLDNTRPTTMAHAFMLEIDEPLVTLPDIMSYNLYYGWYLGNLTDNDIFFDDFHKKYPDKIIGLAEYGADANPRLQTPTPEKGDYTEQYQTVYHEHMLNMFKDRPYLWATHVWNMFDFAADGRDEGGENGINQKGLVTFDRKYKKDAFYLYKAYWNNEPFVHLCGRNYVDRHEEETEIKVYSSYDSVELYNNGELVEKKSGNKVFIFQLKLQGEHRIEVKAGNCSDEITIRKVSERNKDYVLEGRDVINWFDKPEMNQPEGYYSIKDVMADIRKSPEGAQVLDDMMNFVKSKRGDVAKNVKQSESMARIMNAMTLEALIKQAGGSIPESMVVEINKSLNKIKKVND